MRLLQQIREREMAIATILLVVCLVLGAGIGLKLSTQRTFPDREYVIATDHSPPFQIVSANGTVTGAMTEAIERAADRLGVRLRWRVVTGGPDKHLGVDSTVDLWPFVMRLPERNGRFHIAHTFVSAGYVLVSSESLDVPPEAAMAGKRVAFRDIPYFRTLFQKSFPDSVPVPIKEVDDVLTAACRGDADGAVTEPNQLQDFLMRNRDRCASGRLHTTGIANWRVNLSLGSTRECAALADALRAELGVMAREHAMDDIFTRFQPLASLRDAETFVQTETERQFGYTMEVLTLLGIVCALLSLRVIRLRQKTAVALRLADDRFRYLADMSHELRTPLNGILGMANVLKEANLSAAHRNYLTVIEQSGNELLSMINNVLDLAKLEKQGVTRELEDVSPRVLTDTLLRIFTPTLQARGIEAVLEVEPTVPVVVSMDVSKFRQIFVNLVGNAVKFTEQGFVDIHLSQVDYPSGDRHLRVEVIDSGPGISEVEQSQLFQEFGQTAAGKRSSLKGSGLGLQIAKRLAYFAGGRIGVASRLGAGSTFWFEVPIEQAATGDVTSKVSGGDADIQRVLSGKGVLIAGARERLHRALCLELSRLDANVTTANTIDAATLSPVPRFDLLLLDARYLLGAPAEILDQVRQLRGRSPGLEVLAMCNGDAQAARVHALGARFIRCILKPVPLEELTHLPECDLERTANLASLARAVTKPVLLHPLRKQDRTAHGTHPHPLRILVGEDNPVNRLVIQAIIERLGHHGKVIPDGARLVAELETGAEYDLVLMDCNMPGLDGYEASKRIRELIPDRGALPIVAVTANAPTDVYEKCIASGMNDVVGKPVTADVLRDVFHRYARTRQAS
jgi:signal transduction histidine kinase/CheY-like chemotaxis protein